MDAPAHLFIEAWEILLQRLQIHRYHRQALIDVVVEFPRDAGAFCFLCINQLAAETGNDLFSLFSLGDVGDHGKSAGLALDLNQFGGAEASSNLTILPAKSDLKVSHVAFREQLLQEGSSLIGIDPEADVERASTDNLVALPASLKFERLVDFNVAT